MLRDNAFTIEKHFRLKIVESIPQNVTFGTSKLPESTFSAWQSLIRNCRSDLLIAAYKSSLRGKHVLGVENQQAFSLQGEEIFNSLLESGTEKGVQIRIVENYPPKDKGDNEDAASLHRKGAVYRRHLNFKQILGKGTMHSKFIVSDQKSFYLGSANLDWRSLNQKMELGVVVTNCPCLANDLSNIFNSYWQLTADGASISFDHAANRIHQNEASSTIYNMQNPLRIIHHGLPLNVFIATSPPALNAPHRTWDLDAILRAIDDAKSYLYIHVMDYFPMFIYSKPPRYWPTIDDAVRRAIFRGVEVKMLTAALHYPKLGLPFLSSLESLSGINPNGSIEVRIFKVPTSTGVQTVILRERRTHNKFLVSDNTVVIGTSNWSGDYFDGGSTGAAFVAVQDEDSSHREANIIGSVSLIDEMKDIFLRDWYSEYTHSVADYIDKCLLTKTDSFCEVDKDPALLAENQMQ
ncbi:unnamed protein product [Anisakis simplex]|uniref:Phospholipase d-related (inferred by orthology to a S. mansoni protein) n=1 Tax=Anisakis simplex TaxID=6269 RepID=A0A158PN14_ANISI|nr:unnamed protein product [Anisakis simplex]